VSERIILNWKVIYLGIVLILQCLNVLELACAFTLYRYVSYIVMMQTTEL